MSTDKTRAVPKRHTSLNSAGASSTARLFHPRSSVFISGLLALVTRIVYLPVRHHEFLNWDDLTYVLKGTGRLALTETERAELGPAAHRFPLFG